MAMFVKIDPNLAVSSLIHRLFVIFSSKNLKNTFWTPVTVLAGPGVGVIEKSISYSEKYAGGSGEFEKLFLDPKKGSNLPDF